MMKRQRVGVACDKCRLLKAKCDGRQPMCSRCDGYGFTCSWSVRKQRGSPGSQTDMGRRGIDESCRDSYGALSSFTTREFPTADAKAIQSYEALIRELRPNLDPAQQAKLDTGLQNIQSQLPHATKTEQPNPDAIAAPQEGYTTESSPTYVGKASDIHFVHYIQKYVTGNGSLDEEDLPTQSYTHHPNLGTFVALTQPPLVPSQAEAEQFLDVYLSTIHVAYPFICKSVLLREFRRFQADEYNRPEVRPWLALFNFIFAIGSYYTSFLHGRHGGSYHYFRYFEQGLYFSRELGADCSLVNIWNLLVQCFFLLTICHTDRCWNTLGFAIRMGHSIGLHVENSPNCPLSKKPWIKDRSHWRRTWYSMYVLDRLLALQLGRPMAIHEADFHVDLPSTTDDAPFSLGGDDIVSQESNQVCGNMMDYFIAVIDFSCILGLVIRELYRPSQIDISPEQMLHSTATLDHRLTEWKLHLPRHLRFDLGHTFEKSVSFKRQRNMLAVKFHHLRALMHRPFLCLPFLQMNNIPFIDLLLQHKERISEAEYICIHEAQQTAHLLHNVTDERSLVHDFPWWQMIPCLICASSILFVADTFYSDSAFLHGQTSPQALRDAESCLKVFEALSVNSIAAEKAVDMLSALSRARRLGEKQLPLPETLSSRPRTPPPPPPPPVHPLVERPSTSTYPPAQLGTSTTSPSTLSDSASNTLPSSLILSDIPFPCDWPSEISRVMEWSVQFLDHPNFGQHGGSYAARENSMHCS
ncbi:fungal-specific transcription factor domain-containing protein [Aspergillus pseudocaelatus]|uniref:Fungal-specific transcription factor domain-containing protein n=1 Tax=Aspergillus pseudocaelatus TaxID=1825620 RepID=A0ABQ6WYY1_9EURO|nr:fungal-specific transcription factor domain-containing protein [Aspergillus pseudocaelatus]